MNKKVHLKSKFQEILEIVGFTTDSEVSNRLATLYQDKIFNNEPLGEIYVQEEPSLKNSIIIEKNISFFSFCEHHLVPMIGSVQVGYRIKNKVMGLSCIHKIVEHFSSRPQIQERLSANIADAMTHFLETEDVAVSIKAIQTCVILDGYSHAETETKHFKGIFKEYQSL